MRPALLLTILLPALSSAAPAAVKTPSRVDAVTVYRSSAKVTRAARVELTAGAARVLLEGLPDQLDDDSIRVEGKGTARARLFGVSVERVTAVEAAAAEGRAAEERLERLRDDDRALEDRIRAAQARLEFVKSLRSTYSEERSKNLAVRAVSAREWADLAAFVSAETAQATAGTRRAEAARRDLARRIAQARAELEKVQAKRTVTTKTVAIEIEAERAGALELAVSYSVPAAGWAPIWDARLVPESSTIELSFLGSVWQRTGEDWRGVALSVSTAQPARGLLVPRLEPLYLRKAEPHPVAAVAAQSLRRQVTAAPSAAPRELAEPAEAESAPASFDAQAAQATVQEGLLATAFTAPRRETVDGSGQARKISLARFPLEAAVVRTAAPRVDAAAFLTAKAVNGTGFPLLGGMASVYVGDQFAGRAALPFTSVGGELELAFGADDRIEVDRRVLERRHESAGLLTKDEVYRYRVRIGVKNRYAGPVTVKLLDLVPVSRDEKIEVAVLEGTTAPAREDPERPGVRIHELELGAREEKIVELRYEVRYPRNFPIAGLE